jgi:hypothetical protein
MRRALLLVAAAVAVGLVAGLVVRDGGEEDAAPRLPEGNAIAIRPSVTPAVHLVGDRPLARLDLFFDQRVIRPESVRLEAEFEPYRVAAQRRILKQEGDLAHLRLEYDLECSTVACIPSAARRQIDLPSSRLVSSLAALRQRRFEIVQWPTVTIASRLDTRDLSQARPVADLSPPEVDYRLAPGLLGAILLGGGVLLVAAGVAGAALLLPRPRALRHAEHEEEVVEPALSRALELVLHTSQNGGSPEQRKALERLATELGRAGRPELAVRAHRLAWSAELPSRAEVEVLAGDVRTETGMAA